MKLRSISIRNFRCLDEASISIRDLTSLIGPNNCGKSSVLRAIEIFLNQQSPTLQEWRVGHSDKAIVIEGEFDSLQEWERSTSGVAGLVYNDKIKLRVSFSINSETEKVEKVYEAFKQEETIAGWSDKWSDLADNIKAIAEGAGVNGTGWRTAGKREQVKSVIRQTKADLVTYGEAKWSTENISIDAALQQAIPQAQLIPAVRDASDDSKPGSKTSFGLILSKILLPAIQASSEYTELMSAVQKLQTKLAAEGADQIEKIREITKLLSGRLSSVIDAKVLLTMTTPDAEKFIGSNTGLELDDGTRTSINLQGNGLQRALVFALMETLAAQNAQILDEQGKPARSRSTLVLFEEPELFLHPHIMRSLKQALHVISQKSDWQVILTTHSPFMIDIADDPLSLVIFRRENSKTPPKAIQLKVDPFGQDEDSKRDREALRAALNFHPTVCEAFFAKRTVLVEGDSEMAVLVRQPELYAKAEVDLEKRQHCTMVSCGGKWTIPPMANLLKQFGIPFRIIHDQDKKGRSNAELAEAVAIDPYRANARIAAFASPENILIVDDTLEDLFWPPDKRPKSSGDKPHRIWKRVKELVEGQEPLNAEIKAFVQFAFNW
ncbi:MAG TPA: ATP-dependent endonuclease [Verrucomicrobiae bacterium]|nr:ATP-dependent endonuclease [Verrucomicrobiae bacterium]